MRPYTDEDRKRILKKIETLMKEGVLQKDAALRLNVAQTTIREWRKRVIISASDGR